MTQIEPQSQDATLETLSVRLDIIGRQLDWLCENMAGMFSFVQTTAQNGGGIRGMLKSLKDAPVMSPQQAQLKQQLLEEGEMNERYIPGGQGTAS
jgi:hypothetical protein